ncbi:Isoleucyl-tRNA synthetase [Gemmatirosa kalamazoonensis]|uniref:Isoleucine--tRNA ligase n=1 Tax=Gemmatirosa kalamazoonensis TaxID=861299 RepID=W0RJR7_9BACT|nr:isoleucine--tRNA ligase [Gemmatirosa kalamazoonensis]AHG90585.1 Isoleucyl-tRNA synthetase [Gemmatirosa kalamazoonensis]
MEETTAVQERDQAPERERYAQIPPDQSPDALERGILDGWTEEDLFAQTLAAREGAPDFVFFEGPPTANGRPGIHHVFARTIKDLFCRHRAMKGFRVLRKAGWDTHGLPVEIEVEKALGISGKQDIEKLGVAEFNRLCRESVFRYRADWEQLSARMGYWLDYSDPYVTYTNEYVESVWWALKTLHTKDLLYLGHKILPYCPRCGTSLSSHEVAQGYEDVEDPSVFVALDLAEPSGLGTRDSGLDSPTSPESRVPSPGRRRLLVWTTTPWTLVSNTALAVHPDLTYVELRKKSGVDWTIVLAEARVSAVLGGDWQDRWDVVGQMQGRELAGKRYTRPLDWVPYPLEGEHEIVLAEEFVSAEEGTGIVHMAPAFGADDYAAGRRHELAFLQPVNARGEFEASVPVIGGTFFKKADPAIVAELEKRDVLWKAGTMVHSYPHCWRCRTPLIYYARESWFVRTTAYANEMLARNARVDWHPEEVGSGRFGTWLENNIDWAISRDRYWGTPLPVWVNDADPSEVDVIGSYAELAERIGRPLPDDFDPHKPFIDEYTWPAPSGRGTMRRVPQVIDTWFDSGSMSFAQWHYPFENRDLTAHQFPADFIAEGVDQTRGWFYSLLAIATGLGDALPNNSSTLHAARSTLGQAGDGASVERGAESVAAPYRAVVVNNTVVDAQGKKMSKSRGNAVDPWAVIERHGVDAVRLFFMGVGQLAIERRFDEGVIREFAGRFLLTLRNVYNFFALYANFGWEPGADDPPVAARSLLDRWVLSRLAAVESDADALLEAYDPTTAVRRIVEFFDDDVSKWYVRLSRDRFWNGHESADGRAAFATLREVLVVTARLLAPVAPFLADWMHRQLAGSSVHLAPYVRPERGGREHDLEAAMDAARRLATLGRAARETVKIPVRQPLGELVAVIPFPDGAGAVGEVARLVHELEPLLASELNVKRVRWAASGDALVTLEPKPNFRVLGKRFGKSTPRAAEAVAGLGADALRRFERGEAVGIVIDGADHLLEPGDLTIVRRASGDYVVQESEGYVAALDPAVSPELRREGLAREVVSRVQRLRKEAGLAVSDRIRLIVAGAAEVEAAVREHHDYVAGEVLATQLAVGTSGGTKSSSVGDTGPDGATEPSSSRPHVTQTFDLDGREVRVSLSKDEF